MNHANGTSLPQPPHIPLPLELRPRQPLAQEASTNPQAIAPIMSIPKKLDLSRKTIHQNLSTTGLILDAPVCQEPAPIYANQETTDAAVPLTAEEAALLESRAETTATREAMSTLARERAHRTIAKRELTAITDQSPPLSRIHC